MFAAKDSLLTRPSGGGYQISRSLRFNSADSAYLNRTPATTTNRKTFTWSGWVKRGLLTTGTYYNLFAAGQVSGGDDGLFYDTTAGGLYFTLDQGFTSLLITTAVYRDPSAWYHVVIAVDTTQATASNRMKMYVNGVQVTDFSSATYPVQNLDSTFINTTNIHRIGAHTNAGLYFNGYLTEINFIDGQQLTPSSFGSTNADTGVWQPKAYSGSYGTNGFYLNFSDNSNTTAATLGKDYSGNGNNWTPNNFSVTAGIGNDSLVDVPTLYGVDTGAGGSVRGNYCTLNPLSNGGATLANGNLQFSFASAVNWITCNSTMGMSSGKWYWEVSPTSTGGTLYCQVGINRNWANDLAIPLSSNVYGYSYSAHNGNKGNNGSGSAYGSTWTVNDIIGIAFDADAGTLTFYKNNTSQGVAYSGLASGDYVPAVSLTETQTAYINLGQRPFAYTAPSGFKALCTQNLPTPTIGATTATQAGKFFNPVLYTGNGGTNNITGVGFQPDWVWIKSRNDAYNHQAYDAVRGTNKRLLPSTTNAEFTDTDSLMSFNSDGFTSGAEAGMNANAITYVAWNWKANGSGSSNTSGSITSTVSASTTSGFSVVTWTCPSGGSDIYSVGHGLGVTPSMVIIKSRSSAYSWFVWQTKLSSTSHYLVLNTTAAETNATNAWGSAGFTSSVFGVANNVLTSANDTMVAYCFAPIAGYSAFGSYTGNGSADGPFVFTGMRPAYVMVKRTDSTSDWYIWDTKRDTYNVVTNTLLADTSGAETSATSIDDLSNGFKCRSATVVNASGGTYIYMAFAEAPQKFSLAR